MSKNKELAAIFNRIADALEIKGELAFKVQAYRKAARVLEELPEDIETLSKEKRLQNIPGIGSGLAAKIEEYLATGRMQKYEEALSGIPLSLLTLLEIPGLGPKTIHLANKELGVQSLADLKRVIRDGSLSELPGLGAKRVENILKGIETFEKAQERISLYEALSIVETVLDHLKKAPGIKQMAPAGSLRRMKETVGDIDILATGKDGAAIIRHFTHHPAVSRVLAEGSTKGSILLQTESGERQVDLRIVEASEYGAALQYFTGSKAHNIRLRSLARELGLKISEYGVFRGEKKIAGREEAEVYQALGLPWIPPELREDRGEIEAAQEGRLPQLIEAEDIKGDLHVHSNWSDGSLSLEQLAEQARQRGYEYLAICDHSPSAKYARGLTPDQLVEQMKEIDRLNKKLTGLVLLKGVEVDILADGSLDLPDRLLQKLDVVVASVHSGFRKQVTERISRALANPYIQIIGHPSGRLISGRAGYEVNLDEVMAAAKRMGKALELNAYYDRLDLNEIYLRKAKELKIPIAIGTDTHGPGGLAMMRFGVGIARRGWLEKGDVLNCLTMAELREKLQKLRFKP